MAHHNMQSCGFSLLLWNCYGFTFIVVWDLGSRSTIAPTIIHVRPRCKVVFSTLNLDSPMRYIKKKKFKKQKTKSKKEK